MTPLTQDRAASLFPEDDSPEQQLSLSRMAQAYLAARKIAEDAENSAKLARERRDRIELDLLQRMEEAKTLSLKIEDGDQHALLSASKRTFYSLPQEGLSNESLRDWLDSNGGGDAVKLSIHAQTFSSFCNQMVENGKEIHPAVRVAEKKTVSVRAR